MSWNGTVRCGHCYAKGHNKRTCDSLKKYIEENPDSWRAREHRVSQATASPRRCSYCHTHAHNRRTCQQLKADAARTQKVNEKWCVSLGEFMKKEGLGVGALVHMPGDWKNDYEPRLGVIVGFNWQEANFKGVDNAYRGDFVMARPIDKSPASLSDGETHALRLPNGESANLQKNSEFGGHDSIISIVSGVEAGSIEFPDNFLEGNIGILDMFKQGTRHDMRLSLVETLESEFAGQASAQE